MAQPSDAALLPGERRVVASLAAIYAVRLLGLFLLLPVLALHADSLPGATPLLAGLAVGAYGLTQALVQIPFGAWSDRVGRKPVIAVGGWELRRKGVDDTTITRAANADEAVAAALSMLRVPQR